MVWGSERNGWPGRTRWSGSAAHAGVMTALLAGVLALWTVVALVVALLAHPAQTMTRLERDGVGAVPAVVQQGTSTLVVGMRHRLAGRTAR